MGKTICLIVLVCWVAAPVALSQPRCDTLLPDYPWYTLFGWTEADGSWNFCIVSSLTSSGWGVEEVLQNKTVLRGLEQLRRKMSEMQAGSTIDWRLGLGLSLRNGSGVWVFLQVPPESIVGEVRRFAEARHIEVSGPDCPCEKPSKR